MFADVVVAGFNRDFKVLAYLQGRNGSLWGPPPVIYREDLEA